MLVAPLSGPTLMEPGINQTLVNAVTAVQTLANAGTAAIASKNITFTVNASSDGKDRTLNLSARGIAAGVPTLPTTMSVGLYASSDGGTTWKLSQTAFALVAATIATDAQALHLVAGILYQLLVTTLTLGSATSVSVDAALS